MFFIFIIFALIKLQTILIEGESVVCSYEKTEIATIKIRLCEPYGRSHWLLPSNTFIPLVSIISGNDTQLLTPTNIFTHVLTNSTNDKCWLEDHCDILINPKLSPSDFYKTYNRNNKYDRSILIDTFMPKNEEILLIWDDKFKFKAWLLKNGFKDYAIRSLDIHSLTFPCILKAKVSHGSNHVFVINDQQQLNIKIEQFHKQHIEYFIEEALIGMGNYEGIIFGSAYNEELLSLRCYLRELHNKNNNNNNNNHNKNNVFIKKNHLDSNDSHSRTMIVQNEISCGFDLTNTIKLMIRKGRYTGAFCIDFKMNGHKQIKLMDFNPRMCGTLLHSSSLFTTTYLPIAFAFHRYILSIKYFNSSYPYHSLLSPSLQQSGWYHNSLFHKIVDHQKRSVEIGSQIETTPHNALKYYENKL